MGKNSRHLFTSESVTEGHPDKVADQISDGVLDALLAQDPSSRVACETLVTTGLAVIAGEITTKAYVDLPGIVREMIRDVGYTRAKIGFDADTCAVLSTIHEQSPDIAMGVDRGRRRRPGPDVRLRLQRHRGADAAADQRWPTSSCSRLDRGAQGRNVDWLRPDGKSQVTIEYDGRQPVRIDTVVVSTQHADRVKQEAIRDDRHREDHPAGAAGGACSTRTSSTTSTRRASSWSAARTATAA